MLCIFHSKITVVFRSSCCTKVAFVLFINKPVQPVYVCAPFGNLTLLWHCALLRLHLFLLQFFTLWSLKKANSNLTYSQSWWTLQTHFRRMHAGSSRCIFFCLLVHLPRITALGPFAFFPIYSLICARPPPLPHLAPTACFDLLSFCRSAYIMSFPNQWSALVFFVFFLHWQNISLGWLFLSSQLLTHFPHWYSVVGRERWKGFQFGCGHVSICACEPTWREQTTITVVGVVKISYVADS